MIYRVGKKLGRTIYRDDVLIGIMDTADDASTVVRSLNRIDVERGVVTVRTTEGCDVAYDNRISDRVLVMRLDPERPMLVVNAKIEPETSP